MSLWLQRVVMADVILRWCTDVLVVNDIEPFSGRNYAMQTDTVMVVCRARQSRLG